MYSLLLDTTDPAFNLALEEHLFNSLQPDHPGWFLLWRNRPSIIVGRFQNTVEEINQKFVDKYNLDVVRRITGGGAVFHDEGNLNYSFIQNADKSGAIDFKRYLSPIVDALNQLGVDAEFSSRNDITVHGKKISGSAQTRKNRKVLHHGTMLVDLNLDMLEATLAGAPDKYLSKGISSVRSRVTNLKEIWPQGTSAERLVEVFLDLCSSARAELKDQDAEAAGILADQKYRTWEWNFGKSPEYTEKLYNRFPWGAVDVRINVKGGVIQHCHITGDFFAEYDIEDVLSSMLGIRHTPEAVFESLRDIELEKYFLGCNRKEILDFLAQS